MLPANLHPTHCPTSACRCRLTIPSRHTLS